MKKSSVADMVRVLEEQATDVMSAGVRHAASRLRSSAPSSIELAPRGWREWLDALFPGHTEYGAHHIEFWEHVWAIMRDSAPDPFVAAWSRGGGKSSAAERIPIALGLRGVRSYAWYVRETQTRADDSVANIQTLLERDSVGRYYPAHAVRMLTKYGHSKDWNSTRLRTAGGLTVEGIGLDTAARGLKIEDVRPDVIILDDLDGKHDSPRATEKKIETLTTSILPAGTDQTAIIAVQNLIIPHGIFSQLCDGRADFMVTRKVSGPIPAIRDMVTDVKHGEKLGRRRALITGGIPTWKAQNVASCQRLMDRIGLRGFLKECQHEVKKREGAIWTEEIIAHIDHAPRMKRVAIGVDPSGGGADIGIIAAGLGYDDRGYVLADRTQPGALGALNWGIETVTIFEDLDADKIVAEKNFGGDLVESNIQVAAASHRGRGNGNGNGKKKSRRRVPVKMVSASRGKDVRAEPVASLYEDGMVSHVGVFAELEAELTGWVPGDPDSPNRLDALVWVLTELMITKKPMMGIYFPGMKEEGEDE